MEKYEKMNIEFLEEYNIELYSLFKTYVNYNKLAVIIVDANMNLLYFFDDKRYFFGDSRFEDIVGKNIFDLIKELKKSESTFYRVLKTGEPIFDHIQSFVNYDDKRVSGVSNVFPLKKKNKVIGAVEILSSINDYNNLHAEILNQFKKKSINKTVKNNGTVFNVDSIIGSSDKIKNMKDKLYVISNSNSPVLITGETGTGKELVAQSIHNLDFNRKKYPFVALNCAAIPSDLLESTLFGTIEGGFTGAKNKTGLFELADKGTLLLDEINSMEYNLQAKLLRVLQTNEIRRVGDDKIIKLNVRIIATSNVDMLQAVKENKIRKDLYYRLNVMNIEIPPLRDRKDDIMELAEYFLKYYSQVLEKKVSHFSDDCIDKLINYKWPGNIRELKYLVENLVSFSTESTITCKNLSEKLINEVINTDFFEGTSTYDNKSFSDLVSNYEIKLIKGALKSSNGNQAEAARMLKMPRQTLFNKIKKYGIKFEIILD